MSGTCFFCDGRWQRLHHDVHGPHEPVVATEGGWIVVPDIAPVADGHALLMPMRHGESAFELALGDGWPTALVARLAGVFAEAFGRPFLIEHLGAGRGAGPCIDHPHVHVVPHEAVDHHGLGRLPTMGRPAVGLPGAAFCHYGSDRSVRLYDARGLGRQFLRRRVFGTGQTWQEAVRSGPSRARYRRTIAALADLLPPVAGGSRPGGSGA